MWNWRGRIAGSWVAGGVVWRTSGSQLGVEVEGMQHYGSSEFAHWKITRSKIEVGTGGNERGLHQLALVFNVGGIHHGRLIKIESMTRIITHVGVDGAPCVTISDTTLMR